MATMPTPRPERWLPMAEVLDRLLAAEEEHASGAPPEPSALSLKPRKRQIEYVRRMVRRVERRETWRVTKRIGPYIYVSTRALEFLLPEGITTTSERKLENLHHSHRDLMRRVNGYGSKLRDLQNRLTIVEEIQQHIADSQAAIAKATALLVRIPAAP
jgi:hypothetical protein